MKKLEPEIKCEIATYLMTVKVLCPELTSSELTYIKSGLTVLHLKSKEFFIHSGSIQNEIGFVSHGLLRVYCVDNNDREITVKFIKENEFAVHFSAFIAQNPCLYNIKSIEPSSIVKISFEHIQEGYKRFTNMERYGRLIAEEVCKIQEKRIESFLFNNGEERYLKFINENSDLFNRVSQTDLSTYLGISRQSLTRLRKKHLKNTDIGKFNNK